LIPISLIVTVETVKFIQSKMAMNDEFMVSDQEIPLMVNSSNLNEELGQIEYIFTDKTGTLTQNKMIFKNLVINGILYP
jgi:P-type E1-E2 ATPase